MFVLLSHNKTQRKANVQVSFLQGLRKRPAYQRFRLHSTSLVSGLHLLVANYIDATVLISMQFFDPYSYHFFKFNYRFMLPCTAYDYVYTLAIVLIEAFCFTLGECSR